MTIEEFNKKLLEAEEKFKFFDVEIFGKKLWGLLRFNYYLLDEIFDEDLEISIQANKESRVDLYKFITNHFKNPCHDLLFKDLPFCMSQKDILYITERKNINCNSGIERKKVVDDYILSTPDNISYAILEFTRNENSYRDLGRPKNMYYFSNEMITALYKTNYNITLKEVLDALLNTIILPLENFFQKRISNRVKNYMIDISMFHIVYDNAYYSFFSSILKKAKPKMVIFEDFYWFTPILIDVLKSQSIISVIINTNYNIADEQNIAYNTNFKVNTYVPDYIICRGNIERDWFAKEIHGCKYGISKDNLLPIGNISLNERFLRAKKSKYLFNNVKRYLIISSGYTTLKEFALKLSKSLQDEKIEIIYKLHPLEFSQINEFTQYFKDNNVKIKADVSIYNLIETADLIIGEESNAIYESARFYKPIFIYGRFYKTHPLVKHNIATGIASVEDFLEKIKNPEKITTMPENISYFYADNAKENYQKFLRKILKKDNFNANI